MPAKRTSIVDLMKLVGRESSLVERKEMNVWLYQQVMGKLAQNGGKVPASGPGAAAGSGARRLRQN